MEVTYEIKLQAKRLCVRLSLGSSDRFMLLQSVYFTTLLILYTAAIPHISPKSQNWFCDFSTFHINKFREKNISCSSDICVQLLTNYNTNFAICNASIFHYDDFMRVTATVIWDILNFYTNCLDRIYLNFGNCDWLHYNSICKDRWSK